MENDTLGIVRLRKREGTAVYKLLQRRISRDGYIARNKQAAFTRTRLSRVESACRVGNRSLDSRKR